MTKNIVIAALLIISTSMASVAISAQASKNILERDYQYLESRYMELYVSMPLVDNQD